MKYEKNRKIAGIDELKLQKLAKILILPAIVVILVLVIIIAGVGKKKSGADTSAVATTAAKAEAVAVAENESETADIGPDNNVYINDFEHYGLQRDAVPEVDELVMKYQRAKTTGDATMMYEVFGRTDTEGLEEMQAKMTEEAESYEAFEGTICYTTAGVEPDSYLVYISSNVKFAGIESTAPMLTWAYVYKGDDGNFYMKEPDTLSDTQRDLLNKVSSSEDVKLLDSEMKTNLANAVVNDAKLAALYQMWSETGASGQEEYDGEPDGIMIQDNAADSGADSSGGETQPEAEVKIGESIGR